MNKTKSTIHTIHVKDHADFLKNYHLFAERVFWRVKRDDIFKVEIKILAPCYVSEIIEKLKQIKD